MAKTFGQNQPVLLAAPDEGAAGPAPASPPPQPEASNRFAVSAIGFALVVSAFWIGVWGAYLVGYWGLSGLAALEVQQKALFAAAALLPPLLFVAIALLLVRAHAMSQSTKLVLAAADRLFAADETAAPRKRHHKTRRSRRSGKGRGADAAPVTILPARAAA